MTTPITQTQDTNFLQHCLLVALNLDGDQYYLTSNRRPLTFDGRVFNALGWLLQVSEIQSDLKTNNGDLNIALSGIPEDLINTILSAPIKGGEVEVARAFQTGASLQAYGRYLGVITNFSIEEQDDYLARDRSYTVTISCANINTLMENRISGQRTNGSDRRKFFPSDISFDRCKDLQNVNFDFGKKYTGGNGYSGSYTPLGPGFGGGFGGGGFGGGFGDFNLNER
jgi:hypothetical protein